MKKYFLSLVFIIGLFSIAAAQERSYTYIAQRYDWLAGVFRALGLPAGDGPADFQTGQKQRAGAVYYDTLGADAGLYVWSGSTWAPVGKSYYANNGLAVDGDTIKLGGTLSALSHITTERTAVLDSNVILHFRSKYDATTIPVGGENVSFAYPSYAPFQFIAYDTVYTSKTSTPYTRYPQSGVFMSRRIHFPVGGGKRMYGLYGNKSEIMYTAIDSGVVQNDGGDYGGAQINQFKIRNIPGVTGRTVLKMTHSASNDIINNSNFNIEGAFATLSNTYIENDNAANPIRVRGRIFGHNSYLVMGFTAADTLDEWVAYGSGTFIGAPAKITRMKFMQPAIGFQGTHADSIYFMYDRDVGYKSIHRGKIIFGQRNYTTSPYLVDIASTTLLGDTTALRAREVTDTVGYDFVMRRRTDSTLVRIEPWRLPFGGVGGSSFYTADGSLTSNRAVTGAGFTLTYNGIPAMIYNDGTSNRIGYNGTNAYVGAPNGLRSFAVTNTYHMLDGYDNSTVNDTTTVKPTVMDATGKLFRAPAWYGAGTGGGLSGLTATRIPFAASSTTLADDAEMVYDNTLKRVTLGNGTGFGKLYINTGNGSATNSAITLQSGGVSKVHFSAGTSQSELHTSNHSYRIFINGTGNLTTYVGGSTGSTYNNNHASGAHIFQHVAVNKATIDINGVNIPLTSRLNIITGSNSTMGTATLVAGTVTVSTTNVRTGSNIFVSCNTPGGTQGFLSAPAASIVNGTSFVINSSSGADVSTVNWWIVN